MFPLYDGGREKPQTHPVITLFFLYCLWWSKRKNSFCYHIIFCILSMTEGKKKFILLQHDFFSLVYDWAREKTDSAITLFFVYCLWSSKRKNSFCYNLIFSMLSLIEQEKKLFLLRHYFLNIVYDTTREKTHSVMKLPFLYSL